MNASRLIREQEAAINELEGAVIRQASELADLKRRLTHLAELNGLRVAVLAEGFERELNARKGRLLDMLGFSK